MDANISPWEDGDGDEKAPAEAGRAGRAVVRHRRGGESTWDRAGERFGGAGLDAVLDRPHRGPDLAAGPHLPRVRADGNARRSVHYSVLRSSDLLNLTSSPGARPMKKLGLHPEAL